MKRIYIFDSTFNFDTSVIAYFHLFILPIDFGSKTAPPHIFVLHISLFYDSLSYFVFLFMSVYYLCLREVPECLSLLRFSPSI